MDADGSPHLGAPLQKSFVPWRLESVDMMPTKRGPLQSSPLMEEEQVVGKKEIEEIAREGYLD